jgi:hypothetical protein
MTRRRPRQHPLEGQQVPLRIKTAPRWLREYLTKHGPSKVNTVLKYGVLRGFTVPEIHKAAAQLNIEAYHGSDGQNVDYWRLR